MRLFYYILPWVGQVYIPGPITVAGAESILWLAKPEAKGGVSSDPTSQLRCRKVNPQRLIRVLLTDQIKRTDVGTSLVAQWLRIHLPMHGTRVRALIREDPTCRGATKPLRHNYGARKPQLRSPVPQQLKPSRLEPMFRTKRSHRNEKPAHCNKK